MKMQEMLDKEKVTPKEWAIQQLIIRGSKTSLEADRRVISRLLKTLYKTIGQTLTINELYEAIETAAKLTAGEDIQEPKK